MTAPLSEDARAVIAAVLEAVDLPHAATAGHGQTRSRIVRARLRRTVVLLRHLAKAGRGDTLDGDLAQLRAALAEHPPTGYVTYEQAQRRMAEGASWAEAVAPEPEPEGGTP